MSERWLTGRHAIVTGGSRGIGAAIAEELARRGADVTLVGRDAARLAEECARIGKAHGTRVADERCDVTDPRAVAHAFASARERFGDAYVLVNNAGQALGARIADTTLEQWNDLMAVNATSQFLCIKEVLPAMIAARGGRIINIASVAGLKGAPRITAYTASKHAVIGLTRSLALEVVKLGITVNAVCPGYTETDIARYAIDNISSARGIPAEEARAMIASSLPRGTLITPDEVANAVGWLCSPGAAAVTGQSIVVASGEVT